MAYLVGLSLAYGYGAFFGYHLRPDIERWMADWRAWRNRKTAWQQFLEREPDTWK